MLIELTHFSLFSVKKLWRGPGWRPEGGRGPKEVGRSHLQPFVPPAPSLPPFSLFPPLRSPFVAPFLKPLLPSFEASLEFEGVKGREVVQALPKKVTQSTSPLLFQERETSSNPLCLWFSAASGSPQQASSSVTKPRPSADLWSTRKLMRGNESIASVEGTLLRRETEIWKVCKLYPKGSISMHTGCSA